MELDINLRVRYVLCVEPVQLCIWPLMAPCSKAAADAQTRESWTALRSCWLGLTHQPPSMHRVHEIEQYLAAKNINGLVETSPGELGCHCFWGGCRSPAQLCHRQYLALTPPSSGPTWRLAYNLWCGPPNSSNSPFQSLETTSGVRSVMIEYDQRRLPLAQLLKVGCLPTGLPFQAAERPSTCFCCSLFASMRPAAPMQSASQGASSPAPPRLSHLSAASRIPPRLPAAMR